MISDKKPLALITRPICDAKRTARQLQEIGIDNYIEPLLQITNLPNAEQEIQNNLSNCQAIITTSSNAINALNNFQTISKDIAIITVGDNSADIAVRAGFTSIKSAHGDVAALEKFLTTNYSNKNGSFIYASADIITKNLQAGDLEINRIIVYKSTAINKLSAECSQILQKQGFDYILFYSTKTAENFASLASSYIYKNTIAFCLSQKVEEPIKNMGFKQIIISESANSESLLELIRNFKFT